jgi:hypothetical protein
VRPLGHPLVLGLGSAVLVVAWKVLVEAFAGQACQAAEVLPVVALALGFVELDYPDS